MKINYVDGCCGSGKTTALVDYLNRKARKTVVASKTIALSHQTAGNLDKAVSHKIINHQSVGDVRKAMEEALVDPSVQVLFVTHQAVTRNHKLLGAGMADLIIDELPDVETSFERNLSYTYHREFRDYFDAEECQGFDGVKLILREEFRDQALIKAKNTLDDDHVNVTIDMWRRAVNPNWALMMSNVQWLTDAQGMNGQRKLQLSMELMPSVFAQWSSVTIMGANFLSSRLALLWPRHGVEFIASKEIVPARPVHDETTGKRLTIRYFTNKDYSKKLRDAVGADTIHAAMQAHLPARYIWAVNNDLNVQDVSLFSQGHRLAPVSHGMNAYVNECAVVCLFSLNDFRFHAHYLEKRHGIASADLHSSRAGEAAYQLIMRSNLRDPNGFQDVIAWVPDRRTAEFVHSLLPGSKIEYVDLGLDKLRLSKKDDVRPAKTPAERNKAYMDRQRALRSRFKEVVALHGAMSAEYGNKPIQFTLEESVMASRDQVIDMQMADWDELRAFLRDDCYPRIIKDKEANFLICGSLLNKDATPDSYKGKANVEYSTILQIDFDDSDLDPTLASKVLSNIKHLIYNSYNTMKNGKPRYRCIIPLKQAIEPALYELIWDAVTQRFVDLGFNVGKRIVGDLDSGVDGGKDHAASFMYLPSQAKVRGSSFFIECWDAPIFDCSEWLDRLLPVEEKIISVAQLERIEADRRAAQILEGSGLKLDQIRQQTSEATKQKSLESFQQAFAQVGSGEMHGAILSLMHKLVNGGHAGWEIEQIMLGALAGRAGGQDHVADVRRNCRAVDNGTFKRSNR